MNRTLPACIACLLLAASGAAWAQSAAPAPAASPAPAAREGGINLKLDEADKPRPRIMFGPPPGAQGKEAASTLPSLGAEPGKGPGFERAPGARSPSGSGSGAGPFPKDTNPGL